MAEERMQHRIWAEQVELGRWLGHFQTSRGIRKLTVPEPTREAALIEAGQLMCRMLDEETVRIPALPARGTKKFAVTRIGKRHNRLTSIR